MSLLGLAVTGCATGTKLTVRTTGCRVTASTMTVVAMVPKAGSYVIEGDVIYGGHLYGSERAVSAVPDQTVPIQFTYTTIAPGGSYHCTAKVVSYQRPHTGPVDVPTTD